MLISQLTPSSIADSLLIDLLYSLHSNLIRLIEPSFNDIFGSCGVSLLSGVILRVELFAIKFCHDDLIAMGARAISQDGE